MVYYALSISRHEKVLEGLTVSAEMKDMDRFDMIITGLGMGINLPLQVGCMQLVNAIICTPSDHLDYRLHLRNEFMRCGLQNMIKVFDFNLYITTMTVWINVLNIEIIKLNLLIFFLLITRNNFVFLKIKTSAKHINKEMIFQEIRVRCILIMHILICFIFFTPILQHLDEQDNEELQVQLGTFHGQADYDQEEIIQRFELTKVDMTYPWYTCIHVDLIHFLKIKRWKPLFL